MKITDIHTPNPPALRVDEPKDVRETDGSTAVQDSGRLTSGKDQVVLSGISKRIQLAKAAVDAAPDERAGEIQRIRQAIRSGQYAVSPSRIAEKIIG